MQGLLLCVCVYGGGGGGGGGGGFPVCSVLFLCGGLTSASRGLPGSCFVCKQQILECYVDTAVMTLGDFVEKVLCLPPGLSSLDQHN